MSDEDWAFFAPFVIEAGPRRGRRPRDHRLVLDGVFWIARDGFGLARPARSLRQVEFGLPSIPALDALGGLGCAAGGPERERRRPRQPADDRLDHRARPPTCSRRPKKAGAQGEGLGRSRGWLLDQDPSEEQTACGSAGRRGPDRRRGLRRQGLCTGHGRVWTRAQGPARATRATTQTPSWPTSKPGAPPPSSRPSAIERFRATSTAVSTPCETWSSAASQSSNTAAGLATRYDKTADSYLGFVLVASIRLWVRHFVTELSVPPGRRVQTPAVSEHQRRRLRFTETLHVKRRAVWRLHHMSVRPAVHAARRQLYLLQT